MSDSQAYEEVTVTAHGISVIKRFEEDEFPVPAIAFEFSSDRNEPVDVRLRDAVPGTVEVEDLGFHPEYGSEYWTIDEDEINFERELEAGADYTTVYGIRATGTDDVEKFLTRPELAEVDPPLPDEEVGDEGVVPASSEDVVRDVISGESEEVPGLEDDPDEEIETLDLKDPNEGETEAAESDGPPNTTTSTESTSTSPEPAESGSGEPTLSVAEESLVRALATELRENEVSADDVKLLRRAFEIAGQEDGSVKARVERIQSDVADLRAYTDALEEFLDENGTSEALIEDFRADVSDLEETLEAMESTVARNSEEMDAVSDEVGSLGDDVAELDDEVAAVGDDVDEVGEEVADVADDVDEVESTVAELEAAVSDIRTTVEDLEGEVTGEDVADRLDEIEADVSALREWQDQIKETFGG